MVKIAVFDSGFGSLSVIKQIRKKMKAEVIVVGSNTPSILLGGYKSSKVIGVYPPLKAASKKTKTSSIAILSTENVVKSKALDDLIKKSVSKKVKILKIPNLPKTKSTFTIYSSGKITRFQKQLNKIRIKRKVKILKIH